MCRNRNMFLIRRIVYTFKNNRQDVIVFKDFIVVVNNFILKTKLIDVKRFSAFEFNKFSSTHKKVSK